MDPTFDAVRSALRSPERLFPRAECIGHSSIIPAVPGIYAWHFKEVPPGVDATRCATEHGLALLYVGIAPAGRASVARPSNLRRRIRTHFAGNIRSSTLRFSLASLLAERLGLVAAPRGDGKPRLHDESPLNAWMQGNAFVTYVENERPWEIEAAIVQSLDLPLNLEHNASHPMRHSLAVARRALRTGEGCLPSIADSSS